MSLVTGAFADPVIFWMNAVVIGVLVAAKCQRRPDRPHGVFRIIKAGEGKQTMNAQEVFDVHGRDGDLMRYRKRGEHGISAKAYAFGFKRLTMLVFSVLCDEKMSKSGSRGHLT